MVGIQGLEALLVPLRHARRARAGSGSCSGRPPATWRLRRRLRDRRGVSDPSPLLDRAGIEDAFLRLGERLARRGVVADLYVFGGAAMALAFDSRRATRDVDALFEPHGIVHEEALAVAAELGLPRWWLNEQASTYVAPGGDPAASRVFDHPGLRVFAASPEHLLAMKAFAARPRERDVPGGRHGALRDRCGPVATPGLVPAPVPGQPDAVPARLDDGSLRSAFHDAKVELPLCVPAPRLSALGPGGADTSDRSRPTCTDLGYEDYLDAHCVIGPARPCVASRERQPVFRGG